MLMREQHVPLFLVTVTAGFVGGNTRQRGQATRLRQFRFLEVGEQQLAIFGGSKLTLHNQRVYQCEGERGGLIFGCAGPGRKRTRRRLGVRISVFGRIFALGRRQKAGRTDSPRFPSAVCCFHCEGHLSCAPACSWLRSPRRPYT